ncbi:hypothetical protein [Streptomyces canus]|uniref:hypothetical protein n=1 Tax=Streptomyces canus TaxID=58343 RepID=UPI00277D5918|nr:hypothetical protein [Streptomyces canus]MDQ1070809.1 hypothetical protein [Streptomyces canus]
MRRHVTVVPHSPPSAWVRRHTTPAARNPAPALVLRAASAGHGYVFAVRAGLTGAVRAPGTDEHFAADVDACRNPHWLSCSDVLYAGHPRPSADAGHWLREVMAAFPGCRIAAAPLAGGGWAVLDGSAREAVFLAPEVPADQPLLASCLHAWLLTGHGLRDVAGIQVLQGA